MVAQEQAELPQPRRRAQSRPYAPAPVPVTMRALNRLDWVMQHRLVIAGVRVLIRSTGEQAWERVLEHLPAGRPFVSKREPDLIYSFTPAGAPHLLEPSNQHVLYRSQVRVIRSRTLEPALKELLADLTSVLAHLNRQVTFFHAGAVSLRDAGIVLPAPSGTGKSTLVAALLRAGARYYSDEVAAIDPSGRLHPYLKPLWLQPERDWSKQKVMVHSADLGAKNGHRIRPVRLVAFPEWRRGSRLRVEHIPRSTAALALFSNGFAARALPEQALADAKAVVDDAACVHIRYPEAEHAVPVLRELLDEALNT